MNTNLKNNRLSVAIARELERQRRSRPRPAAVAPQTEPPPLVSPETARLLRWRRRRRIREAGLAALAVIGAFLLLSLVPGLDQLIEMAG